MLISERFKKIARHFLSLYSLFAIAYLFSKFSPDTSNVPAGTFFILTMFFIPVFDFIFIWRYEKPFSEHENATNNINPFRLTAFECIVRTFLVTPLFLFLLHVFQIESAILFLGTTYLGGFIGVYFLATSPFHDAKNV